MSNDNLCGTWIFRPKFLQRFATPRSFMIIYGFLGTIQAMAFIYFVVSLTTMERRFKIPSQTTGIMLSGNEISQILLSLFLSYFGGQRNRPRWIAWGVLLSALSCFILATPHFIYGPGEDALALTKEYADAYLNTTTNQTVSSKSTLCSLSKSRNSCDKEEFFSENSLLPVILVFVSQFILGIGNTLYYSLGNTYMDDNTKKKRTPMLLAYASALRTLGPALGFVMGPLCLSLYIDPSLTPLINKSDTRWMGAWWLGWLIIGFLMLIFTVLVGLFPKHLPKAVKPPAPDDELPQYPKITNLNTKIIDEIPLAKSLNLNSTEKTENTVEVKQEDKSLPTMKELPVALKRLLKNRILMSNIWSGVFYIIGASAYITYMAKYVEIQYNRSSVTSTMIAGPAILVGVLLGFLISGWYISTRQPKPRKLLLWNVIVGCIFLLGELSYIFISCPQNSIEQQISESGRTQFISTCNSNCNCESINYSPVCHKPTGQIYFSPCHAGCVQQLPHSQIYTNCSCISSYPMINFLNDSDITNQSLAKGPPYNVPESEWNLLHSGSCSKECLFGYYMFSLIAMITNVLGASGRIGNILVNYRCVDVKDKAFAQGLLLLIVSLFALIPGPIMYGAIIDSTCIEWGEKCGKRTNCLIYNKDKFRFYINMTAFCFTSIGVLLDVAVWYYGKDLNLYKDEDNDENQKKEIKSDDK